MTRPAGKKIVVVGLHPAIDRTLEVPTLDGGSVVRGRLLLVEAAGKGANITHSLSNFGHTVTAVGFLGRWDREFFLSSFRAGRVRPRFVTVEGATRQNVTLIARDTGRDLHVTAGALKVDRASVRRLHEIIGREAAAGAWAVFAGSRPDGFHLADYVRALRVCRAKGMRLCVDTSGAMLRAALRFHPWLIKPNREELAELSGAPVADDGAVLDAARKLLPTCERVLVSLGGEGALLVAGDGVWRARDPRGVRAVHTVGCGDALLAGFLSASVGGASPRDALQFGVACGSACVRSPYASLRSRCEAERLRAGVKVAR